MGPIHAMYQLLDKEEKALADFETKRIKVLGKSFQGVDAFHEEIHEASYRKPFQKYMVEVDDLSAEDYFEQTKQRLDAEIQKADRGELS